jgi:hypothetical protein
MGIYDTLTGTDTELDCAEDGLLALRLRMSLRLFLGPLAMEV